MSGYGRLYLFFREKPTHGTFFLLLFFSFLVCRPDTTGVTAVAASHTSKVFLRQKDRGAIFFASTVTRHRSLGRIDRGAHVTAVAASHTSEKKNTPKKLAERFFVASSTTRHSSLGRIDRNFFRIFFRICFRIFFR